MFELPEGFDSLSDKMKTIGEQALDGFGTGLDNGMPSLKSKLKTMVDDIIKELQKNFDTGSPSKRVAREVGVFLPAGLAMGFETAMPEAMRDVQDSIDKGMESIEVPELQSKSSALESFSKASDQVKKNYTQIAIRFESIESRVVKSIENMSDTLGAFISKSDMLVNGSSVFSQIPAGGFAPVVRNDVPESYRTVESNDRSGININEMNVFSSKELTEVEIARQLKETARDLAEGFY